MATFFSVLWPVLACMFGVALCAEPKYVHVESEELRDLSCYKCYRSVHGENCITVEKPKDLENETCTVSKPYCMVERYIVGNKIATFTRKCSSKCLTGCERLSDAYVIEKCWECCQENFCNIGPALSGGQEVKLNPIGPLLFALVVGLSTNI